MTHSKSNTYSGRRLPTVAGLAFALSVFSTTAFAQYWNTVGTVTHVLQNDTFDGAQQINEVDFLTNSQGRVRIVANGQIYVFPPSGTIFNIGNSQEQAATIQVQGGNASGFASYTFQNHDWGQNIQSVVNRAQTVSYVVNWNGTDRFYVAGQGWLYANGAYFGSDRRLKTDIKNIDGALDKVMRLQGVTYRWLDPKPCSTCSNKVVTKIERRTEMGLVAQDVERVTPEVVRTVADGTKAVAYQNLVALLIEAVKTQQKQMDVQSRQIAALQIQMAQLGKKKVARASVRSGTGG